MSYIEESLSKGEEIYGAYGFHWFAWVPVAIWAILGLVTLFLTWIIALYLFLSLKFTDRGFTNKRVILKTGIISRNTQEMKLTSIETVEIRQGILGRILGYGTMKVTGRGVSDVEMKYLDDPMSVKRKLESISNPMD
ncbi:PH domain-containing protein [Chromohalobacter japonicus]|uniref:PH domain-containing protein n=1 Tax=Chromohalobacter japonicus TaxID=223900 RepID=UPI000694425D|nr:PH domain-containing protein [Chromohalobacter japonicus]